MAGLSMLYQSVQAAYNALVAKFPIHVADISDGAVHQAASGGLGGSTTSSSYVLLLDYLLNTDGGDLYLHFAGIAYNSGSSGEYTMFAYQLDSGGLTDLVADSQSPPNYYNTVGALIPMGKPAAGAHHLRLYWRLSGAGPTASIGAGVSGVFELKR